MSRLNKYKRNTAGYSAVDSGSGGMFGGFGNDFLAGSEKYYSDLEDRIDEANKREVENFMLRLGQTPLGSVPVASSGSFDNMPYGGDRSIRPDPGYENREPDPGGIPPWHTPPEINLPDMPFPDGPPLFQDEFAPEYPGAGEELEPDYTVDEPERNWFNAFAGQARDVFEELRSGTSTPIEDQLMEWLEEKMLSGGGLGTRVNGDGSIDLIGSLGIPGLQGIFDIQLRDAEGNVVAGEAVKDKIGQVWEDIKALPGDIIKTISGSVGEIAGAVEVDSSGNILDAAGSILGSIFEGPLEGLMSDDTWLAGNILGEVIGAVNDSIGEADPTPVDGGSLDRGNDNDFTVPVDTVDPSPQEPPLGGISGEVIDDTPGQGPEDPPLSGNPASPSAGGMFGAERNGYMGGLSYQIQDPLSVLYNPEDPMVQLNRIISRSLFGDMI